MTSITNTPASYYQLSSLQSGNSQSSLTANNKSSGGPSSVTQSLINALQGLGSSTDSSGSSDILDLSPAAQALLNNTSSGNTQSPGSSSSFSLTQAQQVQINEIIAKYKDAPMTQETFNKIQNDLEAAGLGADQLSAKDQVSSLNLTSTLLDALNGKNDPLSSTSDKLSAEQTKANNYMKDVYSLWQQVASGSSNSSSSTTA
ncbi:MAG TPA: hypothetical protein VFT64_03025 [Rickettsiales bacterium]|nr:hypothetical protein [Rickettsiales bacterium]